MLGRSTHNHCRAIITCALFVALVADSSSSNAAPASSRDSDIVEQAQQQIRITASVRPTMTVRRHRTGAAHQRALCIWSNTPTRQYDVRAELRRTGSEPVQLRWNEKTATTIIENQPAWFRDLIAEGDSPSCETANSILTTMTTRGSVERSSGVVTLLISPQ